MRSTILRFCICFLLLASLGTGCKKQELPDDTRKVEDYLGNYSGHLTRERMSPNGWIAYENPIVEHIPTNVEITSSDKGANFLMVYVSAYNDSILCEFDNSTGYILISNKMYSFYMRTHDFPEFKGIYDMAVSTYGNLGRRDTEGITTFGIDFLKDKNDSIFQCEVFTKKIDQKKNGKSRQGAAH